MKKYILTFILGGLFFGSIGTVVALNYTAKDVSYNNITVDAALKDLYNNKIDFSNLSVKKDIKAGSRIVNRTASITLQPGKYILFTTKNVGSAFTVPNGDNRLNEVLDWGMKNNIDSDNDCRLLNRYSFAGNSNSLVNTQKEYTDLRVTSYYCDINTNRTYTVDSDDMNDDYGVNIMSIQAIKLK